MVKDPSKGKKCYKGGKRVLCPVVKPLRTQGNQTQPLTPTQETRANQSKSLRREFWDEAKAVAPGILTATAVFHLLDEAGIRTYLRVREKVRQEVNKGVKKNKGLFKWAKSNPISYKPTMDPAPYLHKVLPPKEAVKSRVKGGVKGFFMVYSDCCWSKSV